ncbi:dipeptidyl peptidase S46 family protein [Neiella marina]|uniref:Dipeptidyl-peptidase n=1 Tax=Neiella marina TaxID=508461 RepID=A0A8J2U216_9GAMM|nr:S46 family peptidase [Neiella marina]GGA64739.1 dipeptidyl peptidase S46 family protein [Neiella marina]
MKRLLIAVSALAAMAAQADEGMWQPHQMPQIASQLKAKGLELDPNSLSSLDKFPMNAVISLGGCTASFVSPKGLVVTNHHCAYGSIQFNSTPEANYLQDGFLAKTYGEELPAAPGSRVYITESVTNVTDQVVGAIPAKADGATRYQLIEDNRKALVAECEKADGYHCSVQSFHHGLEYYLVKKLAIRDVRLVHAPALSVGKFGGSIDNWMWPRHTGDYAFYRAYVGKDGKPADYSKDNVPFEPVSHLTVSAKELDENDFVMVAGYPGRTNRYRTADEVKYAFTEFYPMAKTLREDLMDIIKATAPEGSDARIRYENTLAGLDNYAKNYQSMIDIYAKSDFQQRKEALEADLADWLQQSNKRQRQYGESIDAMAKLVAESQAKAQRDVVLGYMRYASAPYYAQRLLRLAHEQQKPDAAREPGYQERDMTRFGEGLKRMSRRYDAEVDKAIFAYMLKVYADLPASQHVAVLDQFFGLQNGWNEKAVMAKLDAMYSNTKVGDEATRLAWMEADLTTLEKTDDAMLEFAKAMYDTTMAMEKEEKAHDGELQKWRPRHMQALIAYAKEQGKPIYADANSSLRISYGSVKGVEPRDGMYYTPFTKVEGIVEKESGEWPFNAPAEQLKLIADKQYGKFVDSQLQSVPVNYLSTVDTTGGNSGSPTFNSKGELIGLLFDGTTDSIIGDWDFDETRNRSIHVDTRYMLWVMKHLDGADNLIDEMNIVY